MVFVCNAGGGIFRSPSVVSKRCLFLPGFACDGSGGHHGSRLMCLPTGHTCLCMCALPEKFAVVVVVVVVVIVVVVVTDVFVEHRLSTGLTELPFPHQPRRLHILPYPVKKVYVAITIPEKFPGAARKVRCALQWFVVSTRTLVTAKKTSTNKHNSIHMTASRAIIEGRAALYDSRFLNIFFSDISFFTRLWNLG
jgi:hypothetical protein